MTEAAGFQLEGSAPQAYERWNRLFMAPFVQALLERSGLDAGGALLDLACGPGLVARAAAARVGPTGRLVGVDVNPAMIEHARLFAAETVPAIDFHLAPAETLPLGEAEFDAVLCQQGAQFFTDLDAAVAEAARVLRPGGRLCMTVWSEQRDSPYMDAHVQVVTELAGAREGAEVAEALGFPDARLRDACTAAGLRDVTAEQVRATVSLPGLADFVPGHFSAVPWGRRIVEDPSAMARAVRRMQEILAPWTTADGSVEVPFTSTLVCARR